PARGPGHSPTGDRLERRIHWGRVAAIAFSPDGRTVATAGWDFALCILNLDRQTHTRRRRPSRVTAVAFSPDGQSVLTAEGGKNLWLFDVAGAGGRPRKLRQIPDVPVAVAASGDGKALYFATEYGAEGHLEVWTDVELPRFKTQSAPVLPLVPRTVAVSRDGRLVAVAGSGGHVLLYDP